MGVDLVLAVTSDETFDDETILDWSWRLGHAFCADKGLHGILAWNRTGLLHRIENWELDEYFNARRFPTMLRVATLARFSHAISNYDGTGLLYETKAVAEWLERVVPSAHVWFGADNGGSLQSFNAATREFLWRQAIERSRQWEPCDSGRCTCGAPWLLESTTSSSRGIKHKYECTNCGATHVGEP